MSGEMILYVSNHDVVTKTIIWDDGLPGPINGYEVEGYDDMGPWSTNHSLTVCQDYCFAHGIVYPIPHNAVTLIMLISNHHDIAFEQANMIVHNWKNLVFAVGHPITIQNP